MILILLTLLCGYFIVDLLDNKKSFFEKIVLGVAVGFGITNFVLTFNLITGPINFGLLTIFLSLLSMVFIVRYLIIKPFIFPKIKLSLPRDGHLNIILIFAIVVISLSILINLVVWPPYFPDAIALYDFRGNFFSQGYDIQDLVDLTSPASKITGRVYYLSYPLYTSVMHTLVYESGFANPKFLYSFFSIGFFYLVYKFLIRWGVGFRLSLLLFLIGITTPIVYFMSRLAYTNMPYTLFLVIGILYLYEWLKNRNNGSLYLSTLLVVIGTQVRNLDSMYIIYAALLLLVLMFTKRIKILILAIIVILSGFLWQMVMKNIEFDFTPVMKDKYFLKAIQKGILEFGIDRILEVVKYYLVALKDYFTYILLFILTTIYHFKRNRIDKNNWLIELYFPISIFLTFVYVLVGTYFFSFANPNWDKIVGSLYRMLIPITPLILVYSGLTFNLFSRRK